MRFALIVLLLWTDSTWSSPAQPKHITVHQQGSEPSCLNPGLVAQVLREDASLRVTMAAQPVEDGLVLRIRGSNERFTLLLSGPGQEVGQVFDGVSCAAATQVATAFVVSVIDSIPMPQKNTHSLPVPEVGANKEKLIEGPTSSKPPQMVPPPTSRDAILAHVATRIAMTGQSMGYLQLHLDRLSPQLWGIMVLNPKRDCFASRELAYVADESDDTLALRLLPLVGVMFQEEKQCLDPVLVQRAEHLAEALGAHRHRGSIIRIGAAVEAVTGIGYGALLLSTDDEVPPPATLGMLVVSFGIWAGGGVASLATSNEADAGTIASVTSVLGLATTIGAFAVSGENRNHLDEVVLEDRVHPSLVIGGLALAGAAAMLLHDRLEHPRVSPSLLEAHRRRLEDKNQRLEISAAELKQIEDDFRRNASPKSHWRLLAPMLIGASANAVGYLVERDKKEAKMHLTVGSILALTALTVGGMGSLTSLTGNTFEGYRHKLRKAGLEVDLTPTTNGAALVGRF